MNKQIAWLALSLLTFFVITGCEADTDLVEQDTTSDPSDSTDEEFPPSDDGTPPIDNVSYEQTDVATFALG